MAGTSIGNVGTYSQGFYAGQGANREDLVDFIANVDPSEAPLLTSMGKTQAKHVVHEWLTDTLSAVSAAGAVEGADFALDSDTSPARVLNQCQIWRKDIAATLTQRAVNPAGFRDLYTYKMEKASKELTRNIEYTILSANTATSGASGTARLMKTLQTFITSNIQDQATTTFTGVTADATHAGTIASNDVNAMLQTIYTAGGRTDTIIVSPALKRQFSAFTAGQTRNILAEARKLVVGIDIYDSDFGLVMIMMNRWCPQAANTTTGNVAGNVDLTGRVFFLQRSMVRFAWLRPLNHRLVGVRGDSVAGIVLGEGTLEVANEKALGIFKGVNNKSAVS